MTDWDNNAVPDTLSGLENLRPSVRAEIIDASRMTLWRWLGALLFIIIMIAGFGAGAFMWGELESLTSRRAHAYAETVNGFAVSTNFGIGLLIGLFVWIFTTGWIINAIIRLVPMPVKAALYFSHRSDHATKEPKYVRNLANAQDSSRAQSAEELINGQLDPIMRRTFIPLLSLILLSTIITARETKVFHIYAQDGVHSSRFFLNEVVLKPWTTAETVALGCNQTDDGGHLIYEVRFPDGSNYRLPDETPINGQTWQTNLEQVDRILSASGAKFYRWSWMDRDPVHPRCLRGFYAELGEDGKDRLDKLLRLGIHADGLYAITPPRN